MSWQYAGAVIHGDKQNPQPGDYVTPRIHEPDLIASELAEWKAGLDDAPSQSEIDEKVAELEAAHSRTFTWTYDGKQTKAQFVAMVKGEIRAHLQHLNARRPEDDVSGLLQPEV